MRKPAFHLTRIGANPAHVGPDSSQVGSEGPKLGTKVLEILFEAGHASFHERIMGAAAAICNTRRFNQSISTNCDDIVSAGFAHSLATAKAWLSNHESIILRRCSLIRPQLLREHP